MSYIQIDAIECDLCGAQFLNERDADGDPLVYIRHDSDNHGIHVCASCLPEWEASDKNPERGRYGNNDQP